MKQLIRTHTSYRGISRDGRIATGCRSGTGGWDANPNPGVLLFEALESRASEDAARRKAGAGEDARSVEAWDRERAFAGMERLRAEIVVLGGLHGAQRELLQWNRERIKTGRAPAVLPPRLCREAELGAWCPHCCRQPSAWPTGHAAGSTAMFAIPTIENTPPTEPGNAITKDELQ